MKHHVEKNGTILLALAKGEKLQESLLRIVRDYNIQSAKISGIGALRDPELGVFDTEAKKYDKHVLTGLWELISLNGNVSIVNGERFLHLHAALGAPDFSVKGGHLFESEIGIMAEIFIEPLPTPLHREKVEEFGLYSWDPGHK